MLRRPHRHFAPLASLADCESDFMVHPSDVSIALHFFAQAWHSRSIVTPPSGHVH